MAHPTFRELWSEIMDALRADAEALQVTATAIEVGVIKFDKSGNLIVPALAPPFLYVYCLPGTGRLSESDTVVSRRAHIAVLATPVQYPELDTTICEATELCERVERTIKTRLKKLSPIDGNIAIDNPGTSTTRAVIAFRAQYRSTTEAT